MKRAKNIDFRILKIILYLMFRILKYYCNVFEEDISNLLRIS